MINITEKVKSRINDYLDFDSDELFNNGDLKIFGGSVRDSIADQEIHDIDIICGPITAKKLHDFLETKGYIFQEKLLPKDISALYHGISIINEPWSYTKGDRVVQVIRPAGTQDLLTPDAYHRGIEKLINQVDISCCGVSYDGDVVKECYPFAVSHCLSKKFVTTDGNMTHKKRLSHRIAKLCDRGWKKFDGFGKELERDNKISQIIREEEFDGYTKYSKNDFLYGNPSRKTTELEFDSFDDFFI